MGFVFLSYSSADREDARKLVDALRTRGIEVWWDVDRRHEVNEWSVDIDNRLDSAHRILALVTRNVVESPRDFVFAEMFLGRERLKLVALQIGDMQLPYKYQSIMIGLNRRAFQNIDQVLEPDALDDVSAACRGAATASSPTAAAASNPLGSGASVERVALAVATAALEGLPVASIVDAAKKLESLIRAQIDVESAEERKLFRTRTERLRDIGAEPFDVLHPRLHVPVQCVRFADPQQRFALLEYAWDELDDLRESIFTWLAELAASRNPDVRASIGLTVGVLARKRFAPVLDDVLARWILGNDPALRDVADLAFRVALDAPGLERAIATQIQDWARGNSLPPVRAAIELACGYTGSRLPELAIDVLKKVAKTNVATLDVVSLIHDAIDYLAAANKEAADGSLFDLSKLLKGLCSWVDEALPEKGHKMLPLVLFFELVVRLPMRSPKGVPGVLSLQAIMGDAEMAEAVTSIFDVALRAGGGGRSARELASNCLKRLCGRAEELTKRVQLTDDPVLRLAREIYSASPTGRDRDRLAYIVRRRYSRQDLEAGAPPRLPDRRAGTVQGPAEFGLEGA